MDIREPPRNLDLGLADKVRPAPELWQLLMHPLTMACVRWLARRGVDPQTVVWSHSLLGVMAAGLIALGGPAPADPGLGDWGAFVAGLLPWWAAALLLQIKTLLDNVDGSLARATGQVTQMGRYLDTVLDTAVNLLLFLALALHGPGGLALPLALGAYLVLMLLFSLDFNLKRLHRSASGAGEATKDAPPGAPTAVLAFFRGVYDGILAPQDRMIERWDAALFQRLAGRPLPQATPAERLAWHDRLSAGGLANFGLSTQLLVLGLCLVVGRPFAYVYLVYLMGLYAVGLQLWRVRRFRLRRAGAS